MKLNFLQKIFPSKNNKCIVLIYHRVADLQNDPQLLAVTPENFDMQMKFLKENYNVISLQQLIKDLRNKRIKDNSLVITFDDGYNDNLHFAKPILEKYNLPATIFIAAGHVNTHQEFWWDELERIFLATQVIPKELSINLNGTNYVQTLKSDLDRKRIYDEIFTTLRALPAEDREEALIELRNWAGISNEGRPTHRALTEDELKELAKGNLIEIGAHTMSHPVLSNETYQEQYNQIRNSKIILEKILEKEIKTFSYPFGTDGEANDVSRKIVEEVGFEAGIANIQKVCRQDANLFWIPRKLVRNWNLEEFKNNLFKFLSE